MESLYQKLMEYSNSDYYPFHMPGHKRQACFNNMTKMSEMFSLDITEIEGFDNLHQPEGILRQAQERVSTLYGSEESFLLVNGSTCGILAAISAIAELGKKVIVARNCHKAVYNAIHLNRLEAVYIWPDYLEEYDIQGSIRVSQIEKALEENADIAGIILTSPTYDGIVSDVRDICKAAHKYQIPVIVDEAHGAHFSFHEDFPESAVTQGADIVINSTHKTLPALTQTALLHVQGKRIDRTRLKDYLAIYQTSSPSYLLMASIDAAMEWVEKEGVEGFEPLFTYRRKFEEGCKELKHIKIMPWEKGINDPGKLIISVKNARISGVQLYQMLWKDYQIQMEMAAPGYVLGILTPMDKEEGIDRLVKALGDVDGKIESNSSEETGGQENEIKVKIPLYHDLARPHCRMLLWEAYSKPKKWECLESATGKICGKVVNLYPPGIPILVPGEEIEQVHINQIKEALAKEMKVQGLTEDKKICTICM